jgi:hypothetical protein
MRRELAHNALMGLCREFQDFRPSETDSLGRVGRRAALRMKSRITATAEPARSGSRGLRSATISGLRAPDIISSPPSSVEHGCGRDHRAGPERVHRDPVFGEFRGQRQGEEAHRVFGNAVRRMRREPFRTVGERRRDRQDVRVLGAPDGDLGADPVVEGARKAAAAPLEIGEDPVSPLATQRIEALFEVAFVIHRPWAPSTQRRQMGSKRAQKGNEIGLLLVGEPNLEPLIIELHHILQRGSGAVVEVGRARRQPA